MKSLEESVTISMDGNNKVLFTFIPNILQDILEIGSLPEIFINALKKT